MSEVQERSVNVFWGISKLHNLEKEASEICVVGNTWSAKIVSVNHLISVILGSRGISFDPVSAEFSC